MQRTLSLVQDQFRSRLNSRSQLVLLVLPPIGICGILSFADSPEIPGPILFILVLAVLWTSGFATLRDVVDERAQFKRELHASIFSYGLAKLFWAVAVAFVQSVLYFILVALTLYSFALPFPAGFALLFLAAFGGSLLALCISALVSRPDGALTLFPLFLIPQILFGGFVLPIAELRRFAIDFEKDPPQTFPVRAALLRKPNRSPAVIVGSNLSLTRWTWEGAAALIIADPAAPASAASLKSRVLLANTVPLTLDPNPSVAADAFLRAIPLRATQFEIPQHGVAYLQVMTLYCAVEAGLFLVILVLRDPRRQKQ